MDIFNQYAPFIQDYIYRSGWQALRCIQHFRQTAVIYMRCALSGARFLPQVKQTTAASLSPCGGALQTAVALPKTYSAPTTA